MNPTAIVEAERASAGMTRRSALLGVASLGLLPDLAGADPTRSASSVTHMTHQHRVLFGSLCEVIVAPMASALRAAPVTRALDDVWARLRAINTAWNAWKPGELTRLNAAIRERRAATLSPALREVLHGAMLLERASAGFFNAGIGGIVGAWGFHDDVLRPGHRPAVALQRHWREQRPGLQQLEWRGGLVASRNPHVQVDLGGYAKGVAVDQALDRLRQAGIDHAVVNLGGNLATMGQGLDGPWRIGIRDPFGDGLMATLRTGAREAIVTSGSYERFRWLDGERCSHVIDPSCSSPAQQLVSVTVAHACAGVADAAATALLAAGSARWQRVAEGMGIEQAMVVDANERVAVMGRLAPRLAFESLEWRRRVHVV